MEDKEITEITFLLAHTLYIACIMHSYLEKKHHCTAVAHIIVGGVVLAVAVGIAAAVVVVRLTFSILFFVCAFFFCWVASVCVPLISNRQCSCVNAFVLKILFIFPHWSIFFLFSLAFLECFMTHITLERLQSLLITWALRNMYPSNIFTRRFY